MDRLDEKRNRFIKEMLREGSVSPERLLTIACVVGGNIRQGRELLAVFGIEVSLDMEKKGEFYVLEFCDGDLSCHVDRWQIVDNYNRARSLDLMKGE